MAVQRLDGYISLSQHDNRRGMGERQGGQQQIDEQLASEAGTDDCYCSCWRMSEIKREREWCRA